MSKEGILGTARRQRYVGRWVVRTDWTRRFGLAELCAVLVVIALAACFGVIVPASANATEYGALSARTAAGLTH